MTSVTATLLPGLNHANRSKLGVIQRGCHVRVSSGGGAWRPIVAGLPDILPRVIHATTILAVRHQGRTVLAGDGQVTLGNTVLKQGAKKIRRLYNDSILAGFAGSAADSFALFARFEAKLEQYRGNLERSAVEL